MSLDKEMVSQEVGIDATAQDDWDMQRLGKTQQLKVSANGAIAGEPRLISGREISVSTRSWVSPQP